MRGPEPGPRSVATPDGCREIPADKFAENLQTEWYPTKSLRTQPRMRLMLEVCVSNA